MGEQRIELVGANASASIEPLDELPGKVSFFRGNDSSRWIKGLNAYARLRYKAIYPGIDLVFYGKDGEIEYDFVVAAGADPDLIRMKIDGESKLRITERGELRTGDMQHRPRLYQNLDHGKRFVEGKFVEIAKDTVGFQFGRYDKSRTFVIDPSIALVYSTFVGGIEDDESSDIVLDAQNNAYVIGFSTSENFPFSANAYQAYRKNPGSYVQNAAILKFDPSGNLLYSTFLGGTGVDTGRAIAVDAAGNAYVAGDAGSSDFPLTSNAYQTKQGGAFLAELSPDGSTLEYSSYYTAGSAPGSNSNIAEIALNAQGQVVVAGNAGPNLATTANAYMTTLASGENAAYAAIFDLTRPSAEQLIAATYYGTNSAIQNPTLTGNNLLAFALDPNGNIWLGGQAYTPNLPTTANAYQASLPGMSTTCGAPGTPLNGAAYFAELSPDLSTLKYATYFSGKVTGIPRYCQEFTNSLVFDANGNLYVGGGTASSSFPVNSGVVQGSNPGNASAYVAFLASFNPAKFTSSSSAPIWSTYFGGNGGNTFFSGSGGHHIAADTSGNLWISGETYGGSNFPITSNAYQTTYSQGSNNGFLSEISGNGANVVYSTYLAGNGDTVLNAFALDGQGNAYLAGTTDSANFPVTSNAFQSVSGGGNDMFFSILGPGTIDGVTPAVGGNTGDTTITIGGTGFESGSTCSLVQGGVTITSTAAVVNAAGTSITCTFALSGAMTGSYNVVVSNPNGGNTYTGSGAFTVTSGGQPDLSVSIVGRSVIRTGVPSTFYVAVTNLGNEDADFVPLWVTLPNNITFSFDGLSAQDSVQYSYNDGATYYSNVMLPQIAAGQTQTLPLQITSVQDSAGISLTATLQPPWFASSAEELPALSSGSYTPTCVPDPINAYALNCFGPYLIAQGLSTISFAPSSQADMAGPVRPHPDQAACSMMSATYNNGFMAGQNDQKNKQKAGTTPNPYNKNNDLHDWNTWQIGYAYGYDTNNNNSLYNQPPPISLLLSPRTSAGSAFDLPQQSPRPADGTSCTTPPPGPPPNLPPPARFSPPSKNSIDPNFKSGPTGDASAGHYVRGHAALTYDIGFENEATASLPAAAVVVTDQLDPTKVDLTTLSLGTIAFGSNVISLPSGRNNDMATYAPPGVTNYVVRIQGSLNSSTGLLKWTFQTIDPSTGLPPTDPTVGFLPPDSDGIVGQGSVLFTVASKEGQTTDTQITNMASVVFDANSAIQTPAWLNTLDVDAPVSSVAKLPADETSATFAVSWSGTDKGSGIVSYNIYVADNGGAYTLWQNGVATTSANYTGSTGHTYSFYSEATDGAGNIEVAKTAPDTSTEVTTGTTPIIPTTTTLTSSSTSVSQATAVTFTAIVTPTSGSGAPTGTVTFVDGATTLGTDSLDASGKAIYTTSSLSSGTHSITANYGGDTNYAASASSALSIVVSAPADFSIALSPSSGTVQSGSSTTTSVTITPANGFNQPVSLVCSGAPSNTTCSVSPASITPSGTTPSTATLTIQTGIKSSAALQEPSLPGQPFRADGIVASGLLGGGLLGLTLLRARRRTWRRLQLSIALAFLVGALVEGCGGSTNAAPDNATPNGTYTITLTATAGADSHVSTYSLTVQ